VERPYWYCFVVIFHSGVIQCFAAIVNHLNSIFADYSGDCFIPFVGDDVVAKCISNLKKQSCIRYSKRRKFRPKMRRMRLDPLGELERSPRPPSRNWGEGCLLLRGREGMEYQK